MTVLLTVPMVITASRFLKSRREGRVAQPGVDDALKPPHAS